MPRFQKLKKKQKDWQNYFNRTNLSRENEMNHGIIAYEIAKYFLLHLKEELLKRSDLIDSIRFDNKTAQEINLELLQKIFHEFPGIEFETPPAYNFIRKWTKLNNFYLSYDDFVYEAYNLILFERIINIKDWSPESIKQFHQKTIKIFQKFDTEQEGFSISFFIRTENNMREILREIINNIEGINKDHAWNLIFDQSKNYQEVVNEFFEQLLKDALNKSEHLLHNILPVSVSDELKIKGEVKPVLIESATVLFTDFKGFTLSAEKMEPQELIKELDNCFSIFDSIIDKYGLEKIKTIGDAYMCAGGVPKKNHTHVFDVALTALEISSRMNRIKMEKNSQNIPFWGIRIGFHTGPIIAGVIGKKKFSYDIWGDTVNTASRMESSGEAELINISGETYEKLKILFDCEYRGKIKAKNKGEIDMYFLKGIKKKYSQ